MKSKITLVLALIVVVSLIAFPGISFADNNNSNVVYKFNHDITSGANQVWKQGSTEGATFVIQGNFREFFTLKVDRRIVSTTLFTINEETKELTISSDFLANLEVGEHALEAVFAGGKANTTFTIEKTEGFVNEKKEEVIIEPVIWTNPFIDISQTNWYYDDVKYVYQKGIMEGTKANTFSPEEIVTRSTIITTLWKMEGKPVVNYEMTYTDVEQDKWYSEAIRWASSQNIVNGYDDGSFGIDRHVTREELATMLYRYVKSEGNGFKNNWMFLLDVSDRENISEWAYEAVCWMNMNEIINGKDNKMFDPQGNAHRYELAAVLHRFDIKI